MRKLTIGIAFLFILTGCQLSPKNTTISSSSSSAKQQILRQLTELVQPNHRR